MTLKHGLILRVPLAMGEHCMDVVSYIIGGARIVERLEVPEHGLLVLKLWGPRLPYVPEAGYYPQRVIGGAWAGPVKVGNVVLGAAGEREG